MAAPRRQTQGSAVPPDGKWYSGLAAEQFKCVEPNCSAGWQYGKYRADRATAPGSWFPPGTLRTARQGLNGQFEQFCPSHVEAGKRRAPGDFRAFPGQQPAPPGAALEPAEACQAEEEVRHPSQRCRCRDGLALAGQGILLNILPGTSVFVWGVP